MTDRPVLRPDADLTNADWIKQGWDIPASSVVELRAYLRMSGISVQKFKALPAYQLNVGRPGFEWLRDL